MTTFCFSRRSPTCGRTSSSTRTSTRRSGRGRTSNASSSNCSRLRFNTTQILKSHDFRHFYLCIHCRYTWYKNIEFIKYTDTYRKSYNLQSFVKQSIAKQSIAKQSIAKQSIAKQSIANLMSVHDAHLIKFMNIFYWYLLQLSVGHGSSVVKTATKTYEEQLNEIIPN